MTFIDRIESLSTRFLSDRTHQLIVAPAIADVQYDSGERDAGVRARVSVLVALAGGAYEELTSDLRLLKLAGLALIPGLYYAFLLVLVVPEAGALVTGHWGPFALAVGIAVLSFGPVLVCCWPERTPTRSPRPDVADA